MGEEVAYVKKLFKLFLTLAMLALTTLFTHAEETTRSSAPMDNLITIEDLAIATAIENHFPQKTAQSFPATVRELHCFTKVVGARTKTFITHTWYYQDTKMATMRLPVNATYWRTWSTRTIMPEWKGPWRVEVSAEDGALLKTITFNIE